MTPVLVIITVFMIILMTGVSIVSIMLGKTQPGDISRCFRNFSIFMMLHMIFSFLFYYFESNCADTAFLKILGIVSDFVYFGYVAAWLNIIASLLAVISHRRNSYMYKINKVVFTFAVCVETVIILFGKQTKGGAIIDLGILRNVVSLANILFAVAVISVAIAFMTSLIRIKKSGMERSGGIFFSVMMILYMMWVIVYDFTYVNEIDNELLQEMIIDPILMICSVLDIGVLIFFFRKFPFERTTEELLKSRDELVESFAVRNGFTEREKEVLACVCSGSNNSEIANELFISENTVKRHMNNIFRKAGARNRYELISKVLE